MPFYRRIPDLDPRPTLKYLKKHERCEKQGVEPDKSVQEIITKVVFANHEDLEKLEKNGEFGEENSQHVNNLGKVGLLL